MENLTPPVIVPPAASPATKRRMGVTVKLILIAAFVLVLQLPLALINDLRQERAHNRAAGEKALAVKQVEPRDTRVSSRDRDVVVETPLEQAEGYRIVERALKHSALVLTLVFAAFFLFEVLAGLRLHAVQYGLVGAALCLFYLALLALGEVLTPGAAYVGAAVASSLLIVLYSVSVLHSAARAGLIAALLAGEHSVLYVVLRMEDYALLAGTASLFVVLGAVMWFTRNVDWFAEETGAPAAR